MTAAPPSITFGEADSVRMIITILSKMPGSMFVVVLQCNGDYHEMHAAAMAEISTGNLTLSLAQREPRTLKPPQLHLRLRNEPRMTFTAAQI